MIKGFAHVCFHVRDLAAAEEFYSRKLGFRRAFDFHNDQGKRFGVYMHINGRVFIELFRSEVTPPQPTQSYRHICLEVDDMDKTVAELRALGVEVTDPKPGTDRSLQAWLSDPDGNRMELHCYTPQSKQNPWLR
jgi:catechol 2,3-dioxygenase-like lactoylglutathione lyase family enzyme